MAGISERLWRAVAALAFALAAASAQAIEASDRYRSPRNAERKIRPSTNFIVLHTTEAPAKSSLNKLSERGECHFCVTEDGTIYRIVDRDKEAFHAGRSMWNGKEDLDRYSIGIECVGYHDKEMSLIQLYAIRDLVSELKSMYRLSDDNVVTHSQVAYGAPNKWQKKKHRGRKRCGMLFAMPSVRRILGLKARKGADPDVKAKRLVVADKYLEGVLYGKTDTLRAAYAKVPTPKPKVGLPTPKPLPAPKPALAAKPPQARRGATAAKPKAAPGAASRSFKSIPQTIRELQDQGYTMRGKVVPGKTASKIAGSRWNSATTYYTIRNKVIPGNVINPARIEEGMCVWMK